MYFQTVLTVSLTITAIFIAATNTLPVQSRPSGRAEFSRWQSCDDISLTQKTGEGSTNQRTNLNSQNCFSVSATQATSVVLNNPISSCRYQVMSFSGSHCDDETAFPGITTLSENQPNTKFNERKSVCSYIVRFPRNSMRSTAVQVKFFKGSKVHKMDTVSESSCYNVCSRRHGTYDPDSVGVYRENTDQVADHHSIQLFSQQECEFGSEIIDVQERAEIPNLAELTQSTPIVRSYKISRSS